MTSASARSQPRSPFLDYLASPTPPATLIAYNPSGFDPRRPLPADGYPAAEIRADLAALRPGFDGLVLYAYQPGLTPTIVGLAADLGYRAILLGIGDPKSAVERNGVAALVAQHHGRLAFAVVIGNEGINDNRYELSDLRAAADDLVNRLPPGRRLMVTTSEPAGDYGWIPLREFGDFLAPNIHPALDRPDLAPDGAAAWVRAKALAIARAAGKPVLIKETGLPHGGAPGLDPERQRAFWAAYVRPGLTEATGRPGAGASFAAAFEAFDSPWKADALGNPWESRWGLLALDRTPYQAFAVWSALRAGR
jgi:exo-beta-1,3-glucanase (GH17 family)